MLSEASRKRIRSFPFFSSDFSPIRAKKPQQDEQLYAQRVKDLLPDSRRVAVAALVRNIFHLG